MKEFIAKFGKMQSCLMQDEPGARVRFSYKMSLSGEFATLGFDYQREDSGRVEPGGDPGVFGSQ